MLRTVLFRAKGGRLQMPMNTPAENHSEMPGCPISGALFAPDVGNHRSLHSASLCRKSFSDPWAKSRPAAISCASPTLALFEVWTQNHHQPRVPHPSHGAVACEGWETTNAYVPIFIPLGGPQAHERSGRDDKSGGVADEAFAIPPDISGTCILKRVL
jgi:hypothetical protein